jgi:hypothetical protein
VREIEKEREKIVERKREIKGETERQKTKGKRDK